MYEDIIAPRSTGGFHWDWDEYKKKPYCPTCNSKNLRNTKDLLKDKKLTNWKICEDCGQEWKEIFNEDLELELTEVIFTQMEKILRMYLIKRRKHEKTS